MSVEKKLYIIEGIKLCEEDINDKYEDIYDILYNNLPSEKTNEISFVFDGMDCEYCIIGFIFSSFVPYDFFISDFQPLKEKFKTDMLTKINNILNSNYSIEDIKIHVVNHFY